MLTSEGTNMWVNFKRLVALASALLLGLAVAVNSPVASAAEPVSVTAVADSYVDAALPTSNFGRRTSVAVDGDPHQVAYLKFNVPAGTDWSSGVRLRVFSQSTHNRGFLTSIVADTTWTETGITYQNKPSVGAGSMASGPLTSSTWVEVDITSLVTQSAVVSLALQHMTTSALRLTTREGANAPQLVFGGGTTPPPPPAPTEFVVRPVAPGPYQAVSTSTPPMTFTGSLKSVGERAVAELMKTPAGGTVRFTAATFDFGTEYFKFSKDIRNIDFVGAGIDQTIITNNTDAAADTEPFNFTGTDNVKIRNMTVKAGGVPRTTSDALDFDKGNNSLVENVKIPQARGRGIVFDGKDAGWTSENNTVRNCVITGVSGSGIEFLASSKNTVTGCTITSPGKTGVDIRLSSPTAPQPNKPSNNNTISGNTIDQAGEHGIYINTGNGNKITGNRVTNSSDKSSSRDGIRISTTVSGLNCDDNIVTGNTSIDNQPIKTQTWGLHITHAACNRTVIGAGQTFAPNRLGDIRDMGAGTIRSGGTTDNPPTVPKDVTAVPSTTSGAINVSWSASTDTSGTGLAGYRIYRDTATTPAFTGSVTAPTTTFTDTNLTPGSTHTYRVSAIDTGGHESALSSATSPTAAGGGGGGGVASATFTAVADATVDSSVPSTNAGNATTLRVDNSPAVSSYVRFTPQGLAGTLTKATLSLYANSSLAAGFAVCAVPDNAWTETGVTYASAPAYTCPDTAIIAKPAVAGSRITVDVTSLMQQANGDVSFVLIGQSGTALSLASRTTANPPQLALTTTG
jgi:parallel beta-helix repeat protein